MEIEINSTWSFDGVEGFENTTYRVLSIEYDMQAIIVFPLLSTKKILRPKIILISTFEKLAEENSIQVCEDEASQHLMINDDEMSEKHKERRDTRYRKIESLIKDDSFLLKLATQSKVPDISRQAKAQNSDNKSIYRILNTYWHFGQTLNSLAPAYKFCGGRGKIRENVKHSLGRRIKPRTAGFSEVSSYIVRAEDLKKFEMCLRKYYLKPRGMNLKETYLNTLRTQYTDVIVSSEESGTAPRIPSYRQFVNWSKKIIGADESVQARSTETEYLRNKRGVEASITDKTGIPGSCFEIDATVADVHIVSELRRNHVIGRPTIYSIVDRASRLIVGFHVSLYFASWDAARQALVNAFTPKVNYCKNYGIEIDSCQWPSSHIPQRLICDNGELIGLKAEQLLVPLTELKIAPPYRPDCKTLVERRFGYLNDKEIHHLLGSSRGGKIVRGSPDPRKNAVYTLREVSAILIREVLEHNKQIFSELAMSTPLLIEEDLAPTPNNYWKIHLEKHKHALKTASINEINARLLPKTEVSMTRNGVQFQDMYYSCDRIRDENLTSKARNFGRFRLEARIDYENTSYIYVRLNQNEGFTRCELVERNKAYRNLPVSEVLYLHDWLDDKKRKHLVSTTSIDNLKFKSQLKKEAKTSAKDAPKLKTKSERFENVKQRRRTEIEYMKGTKHTDPVNEPKLDSTIKKGDTESFKKVTYLPRRKRGSA